MGGNSVGIDLLLLPAVALATFVLQEDPCSNQHYICRYYARVAFICFSMMLEDHTSTSKNHIGSHYVKIRPDLMS